MFVCRSLSPYVILVMVVTGKVKHNTFTTDNHSSHYLYPKLIAYSRFQQQQISDLLSVRTQWNNEQNIKYIEATQPTRTTSWTRWTFCSNRQQMGHLRLVGIIIFISLISTVVLNIIPGSQTAGVHLQSLLWHKLITPVTIILGSNQTGSHSLSSLLGHN